MTDFVKFVKSLSKSYLYSLGGLILAVIFVFILNYFQYYIHEMGHAIVAIFSAFAMENINLTITFNYVSFWGIEFLKVPQQTGATILNLYSLPFKLAGIFSTFVFYLLILSLLDRIKIIRENKILEWSILIAFVVIIVQDIALNIFCGTDGFEIACNDTTLLVLRLFFNIILLLSLGFFFALLTIFIKNKKLIINKEQSKKNVTRRT